LAQAHFKRKHPAYCYRTLLLFHPAASISLCTGMAPQALTLLTLLIAHGLVDVTASPPQDLSLMQKSAIVHSESPIVAADEGTAAPAQEVDDDHEHDHEEDVEEEDHDDHEGEHDEHHDDHVAAMKALKVVLVEIDAAIEDIAKEGKEAAVLGHLDHAAKSIAVALGKEKGHGPDESHENSHEHEHSAEKLKHAQEHLEHAIADLKEHKEGESEAEHAEHTGHATKDLKTVKETVMHALSDGLRACATGEVEHALRDLLKAMIAASGPKPEDAAALIQHAIGDLEHATEDLKGLTDEEHKFEQDSHALEDIQHAVSDLKHALEDLAGHEGHEGADADTEHMMKDLKHAMRDLKCANDDLHTAHSLSDLHCALKDLGHIAEHKDDATEMAHVAECIAEAVVHAAVSAVKSKHL